jgi:hypothetical protein
VFSLSCALLVVSGSVWIILSTGKNKWRGLLFVFFALALGGGERGEEGSLFSLSLSLSLSLSQLSLSLS